MESRVRIGLSLVAAGVLGWIMIGQQSDLNAAQQSNFMGGNPRIENSEDVRTLRLLFPAGVRSNWHSHSWGQLLMVEEGSGRTQVRGGPMLEALPGDPWFTAAGVEHWHGAAPDEDVLQMTIYEGTVEWLEGVSDEVYNVRPSN
jgi:quercetin dioxygenase-like cupin family protein